MARHASRQPMPPRELLGDIDQLAAQVQQLQADRDAIQSQAWWLEGKARNARAAADAAADRGLRKILSDQAGELTKQADAARAALHSAEQQIARHMEALGVHHAAARKTLVPAQALTVPCPGCGKPADPWRTMAAGKDRRQGWFQCGDDDCDTAWSATWSGGADPVVKVEF